MKKKTATDIVSFRAAVKTIARAARRKAFRKGLPVAITKNGEVVFVYKDKSEATSDLSININTK